MREVGLTVRCFISRLVMRGLDEAAAAVEAHQRAQQLAPHAVPVP